ncbi:MAG: D-amino acid aminotransferase [Gammaproteobacteria bacterium]|nr:MAG: D-amino acid aminotransferase [Gammaproteobacteria bacterium]RLA20816.1 MAG: D-amino acid aminotransferase [Gammaproteobacteria bacterium]
MSHNEQTVYLNGQYLPINQAQVSVLDRGFLFGDGVYEVIPVFANKPFRLHEHLLRLDDSLNGIRLASPFDHKGWKALFTSLIEKSGGGNLSIYLQVTRGVTDKRDHALPKEPQPTVFVMCSPMPASAPPEEQKGACAITLEDNRWHACNVKAITLLANILLRQKAVDKGCAEAILLRDGMVTEGAASNLFAVIDSKLVTPPKSNHVLPGITRDLIIELANANGLPCEERTISAVELRQASEVWVTSSTREILPIIKLDEQQIGTGKPGPLWLKMQMLYQNYKQLLKQTQ